MNRATCAAALLALLVLPGCAEADPRPLPSMDLSTAPSPSPSPSAEPATLNPAQVRRRLERKDTGHFISTYELDGVLVVKDGVYRISDASSLSDATVSVPDGSELRVRALVADGTTFGQVDNGARVSLQRCWFRYDELPLPRLSGALAPEIAALLGARDDGDGPTADLATTAFAFGSDFVTNLGMTSRTSARTPIAIDFSGDTPTGWSVAPRDVLGQRCRERAVGAGRGLPGVGPTADRPARPLRRGRRRGGPGPEPPDPVRPDRVPLGGRLGDQTVRDPMSVARPRRALAAAALVGLCACTPPPRAPAVPPPGETLTPAPVTGTTDGTLLTQARTTLADADTAAYTTVVQLPTGSVSRTGIYRLSTRSTRYTVTFVTAGETAVTSDVIALGKRTWVRIGVSGLPSATGRTCWVKVDPSTAAEAVGLDFAPVASGYPPEIVAVTLADGGPGTPQPGTSDLATLADLVIGRVPSELGITARTEARVRTAFVLAGGGLTGYDVDLDDVLAAAEQAAAPTSGRARCSGADCCRSGSARSGSRSRSWHQRPPRSSRTPATGPPSRRP